MWQVPQLKQKSGSLQDLSLRVLSGIGCKLWEELIRVNAENAWSDAEAVSWMETCQWLQHQIHSLPSVVANKVCSAMILALKVDKLKYDENVERLFTALLNPDMTELILIPDHMGEFLDPYIEIPMVPVLCKCALSLKKLKIIRIPVVKYKNYMIGHMVKVKTILATELEEFTFPRFCTDSLLENIASSCPRLKRLHVNYCRYVSGKSIRSILKLRNLEYLSIVETRIFKKGLNRLKKNGILQQLKYFGSNVSCCILVSLIPELKNVNTLELCYSERQCKSLPCQSLSESKQLKELKNVVIRNSKLFIPAYPIEQLFFEAVASQLVHLHLCFITKNWFKNVLQYCKSLKCLKVKQADIDYESEEDVSVEQDNMKLESLISLYFEAEGLYDYEYDLYYYILSKCINIRKLGIACLQTDFALGLLREVYISNPLAHLEELVWYEDRQAIELITAEYPGLKTVRGEDYIYSRD